MAHAFYHAKSSARRFGGKPEDYMALHEFMDHTKAHLADARHRLVLHNSWGIFMAEKVLGKTLVRASDGKEVPVRTVLEQHVLEDLGCIPTLEQCLATVNLEPWMYRNAEPLSTRQEFQERRETDADDTDSAGTAATTDMDTPAALTVR
jgi:hypothetical protein